MMQAVQVFSTIDVPARRKVEMWNSMLGELIAAVQIEPRDPLHFDGTLIRQRVGPLTLFEVRCASVRLSQQRPQARRNRHASCQVLMPLQGEFTLLQGDRPLATVGTGSFCLIDRSSPYELNHGDGLRTIGVEFPLMLLETSLPDATHHAGRVAGPNSAAGRVLGGLLRTLGSELNHGAESGVLPPMMARSIAGFVAAAFAEHADLLPRRGDDARLAACRDYVEHRLGDGDFGPADVARHFNVSERYMRLIFQSSGESLSAFLLRRRLERAAQLLRSPYHAQHTIIGIALECGFNSASHFGQSFRQRYGVTPREYRAAGVPS